MGVTAEPMRPPAPRVAAWPARGVAFALQFQNRRLGRADPLISTGTAAAGDLVFVSYVDAGHVQFGLIHNQGETIGPPVPSGPDGAVHAFALRAFPGRLTLLFDGRAVLEQPYAPSPADPASVYFGIQGYPAPTEPIFEGQIGTVHEWGSERGPAPR